jgi:hypothetical protein
MATVFPRPHKPEYLAGKNTVSLGGEDVMTEVLEERYLATKEIERRRTVCKELGIEVLKDIDGSHETKMLASLAIEGQGAFLYIVANRQGNPRCTTPKLIILYFGATKNACRAQYQRNKELYDQHGAIFLADCRTDLVCCVSLERQQSSEYQRERSSELLSLYRQKLSRQRDEFISRLENKSASSTATTATGKETVGVEKPTNNHRSKLKAKSSRLQAVDAKTVESRGGEKEQLMKPIPDVLRQRKQQYAVISFLPDTRPGVDTGRVDAEPWFRVYGVFESEEKAHEWKETVAAPVVTIFDMETIDMYEEWSLQQTAPTGPGQSVKTIWRNPEINAIMHAPEKEQQRVNSYRNYCKQEGIEIEEIELDTEVKPSDRLDSQKKPQGFTGEAIQLEVSTEPIDFEKEGDGNDSILLIKEGISREKELLKLLEKSK